MQVLPGKRKGSYVYTYDDYLYTMDNRYNNVYRCNIRRSSKCPGVIFQDNNGMHILKEHNHQKLPFIQEQFKLKEEMLRLSRETCTSFKEIFDSVCRSNPDAAQYLSFPSIRCSMHRERMKTRPSVPDTLATLYNILKNSDIIPNISKENIITVNGKTAIILSTDYLLQALSSATEIYVDGTFSGIATLFILCDARTTTLYDALWDKITQLVPQLEQNVKFVMSDFEIAAVKSLHKKFPSANLTGCWFHFNQAVLRKWRKLRLSNISKTILSMTMTLPLLPPDMFQQALFIIQTEADLLSNEHPDILQFISYLRLTWLNMASKISTYRCPVRTNNIVESFHNIAVQKLGTRNINIWTFLDKLSYLITDQELDLRRLNNGVRPRRLRTKANRELDSKIINAQEDLVNQRLSLREFLLMFTKNNNIFQMEQMASLEDIELTGDDHVDMELFSDSLNETFQTERQNNRRIYRGIRRRNLHSQEEVQNVSEISLDVQTENDRNSDIQTHNNRENSLDIQTENNTRNSSDTEIHNDRENSSDTQTENNREYTSDIQVNNDRENSLYTEANSDRENSAQIITHEQSETNSIFNTESDFIEIEDDETIYEVPEDEYLYLINDNTHSEELTFHAVDWENNQNPSEDKPSEDTCTVCLVNERTHAFIPCGHLACCSSCIERLEANRCPICNVTYENHIRIRKP